MIHLQAFDPLAVRAGLHALIIAHARSAKGRKRLVMAVRIIREQAIVSQVMPPAGTLRMTPRQRETLDEGALYLEAIIDLLDQGKV